MMRATAGRSCEALRQEGYEVVQAVMAGRRWGSSRTARPDLVVTDMEMPEMDGQQLCTEMHHDPNLSGIR